MKNSLFSLCLHYLSKHKTLFFSAFLCGCIYGVMSGFGLPIIFEKVFRKIFEDNESYSITSIILIAISIPIGFFIRSIFGYFSTFWMNRCGLEILSQLRSDIFRKIQQLSLDFFDTKTSGDLIHRVVSDPKSLQDILLEMASESIKQPLQMIAAFTCLIYLSFKYCNFTLFCLFFIILPVCFLPVRLLRSRVKNSSRLMQKTEADVTTCVTENLQAAQEIRVFNLESMALDKIETIMLQLTNRTQTVVMWQKMQQPIMEVVATSIISLIFIYAYFNKIPFSVFSAMGTALYFAFDPIKKITYLIGLMQRATGAFERILEILNQPIIITSPQKSTEKTMDGSIIFKNVSFSYTPQSTHVLKNIDLEIPSKSFFALVGPSGAGKSTFIKLLPRLYDPTEGSILFGSTNLKNWDLKNLRQQIAVVSQSPVLFNDTFANNLRFGKPNASEEELVQAAKTAYAHDFIMESGGYNATVGENGRRFSGGQRQRLAIARAFLKNAPVLILDEATSALDSESEFFIKKAIENIAHNKTIIAIAHRISTIQNADCILVFNHGKLIAQGKHSDLLQSNDLYKQLVEKQMVKN